MLGEKVITKILISFGEEEKPKQRFVQLQMTYWTYVQCKPCNLYKKILAGFNRNLKSLWKFLQ